MVLIYEWRGENHFETKPEKNSTSNKGCHSICRAYPLPHPRWNVFIKLLMYLRVFPDKSNSVCVCACAWFNLANMRVSLMCLSVYMVMIVVLLLLMFYCCWGLWCCCWCWIRIVIETSWTIFWSGNIFGHRSNLHSFTVQNKSLLKMCLFCILKPELGN